MCLLGHRNECIATFDNMPVAVHVSSQLPPPPTALSPVTRHKHAETHTAVLAPFLPSASTCPGRTDTQWVDTVAWPGHSQPPQIEGLVEAKGPLHGGKKREQREKAGARRVSRGLGCREHLEKL